MGHKHGGFGMGAKYSVDEDRVGTWIEDGVVARVVLTPLAASGLLSRFRFLAGWNDPAVAIESEAALLEQARSWRAGMVELVTDPDEDPDGSLVINPDGAGIHIALGLGGKLLAGRRETLIADYTGWVQAWTHELDGLARLVQGALMPHRTPYPRARPPRQNGLWPTGALVHHIGISYQRKQGKDEAAILERLLRDPLPDGATRSVDGDVLTLRFTDRLDDPEAMAKARTRHEGWLLERVGGELERGWNEDGDRIVATTATPHDDITLYDSYRKVGYQALVVQPDGSVDDEVWDAALALRRAGKLPGGEPLTAVRLIVPRREDALTIYDRALAAGFDRVLFGRDQRLWDPRAPID